MSNQKAVSATYQWEGVIKYIVTTCICIGIVLQGGYFPVVHIGNTIVFSLVLLFTAFKKTVSLSKQEKFISALVILLCFIYVVSSIYNTGGFYKGMVESSKIFGFGMIILVIFFRKEADSTFYLKSILTGCLILSVCGILMYLDILSFSKGVIIIGKTARLQSFIQYANTAGVFFGIGAFIACYRLIKASVLKERLKYLSALYVLIVSAVLTYSRASIIIFIILFLFAILAVQGYRLQLIVISISGLTTAILMNMFVAAGNVNEATLVIIIMYLVVLLLNWLLFRFKAKLSKAFILSGALVLSAMFILFLILGDSRLQEINIMEGTLAERFIYWKDAFYAIKDHIFTGIGPARWENFQFYYQTAQYDSKYIHNSFLQVFLDSGIIAFATIITITIYSLYFAVKNLLSIDKRERFYSQDYFLVLIFLYISIHAIVDLDFSFSGLLNIFGVIIGLTLCKKDEKTPLKMWECKLSIGYIFSVFILVILLIPSQTFFSKSRNAYFEGKIDLAESYIKIAGIFRPFDDETFALHADIIKERDGISENYIKILLEAHKSEPYQPLYLKKLSAAFMQSNSREAVVYLKKLVEAAPLLKENDRFISLCLEKLMSNKTISTKEYKSYKESFGIK